MAFHADSVSQLSPGAQGDLQRTLYCPDMADVTSSMAERISRAVSDSGKSLERLAEETGCTHSAISQWQRGKVQRIKADLLVKFADATGVEMRWLVTGQGPQRSRYLLSSNMDRVADALAKLAREQPLQVETVVRMVEAAATVIKTH